AGLDVSTSVAGAFRRVDPAVIAPAPWPVICSNVPEADHQRPTGAVRAATRPVHFRSRSGRVSARSVTIANTLYPHSIVRPGHRRARSSVAATVGLTILWPM